MTTPTDTFWTFDTARFSVRLELEPSLDQTYDGDDEDGETQRKINDGIYTMFDSRVVVYMDGHPIGADSLCCSVYDDVSEFWTAHRTSTPEYRNTLAQKARRHVICHYFPDMVRNACAEARKRMQNLPELRKIAA